MRDAEEEEEQHHVTSPLCNPGGPDIQFSKANKLQKSCGGW